MNVKTTLLFFFFLSCTAKDTINEPEESVFPVDIQKAGAVPPKERFYLFILAGQSNMAGRAFVRAEDTVSTLRVLTINKDNDWVYAKEPLHCYEDAKGLGCGLSFGKRLSQLYGDSITIGLIPCAIGGTTIEEWLNDSFHSNVQLYTNFKEKIRFASQYGTIKGLLWHQGENNATPATYHQYKEKLESFFVQIRKDLNNEKLPIYAGELSPLLARSGYSFADSVNKDIYRVSSSMEQLHIIKTSDLSLMKDLIHFNSASQREMGKRFASAVFRNR